MPNSQLDRKLGQMFLAGFRGYRLDALNPIVDDLRKRHLGAVVLFDYDVVNNAPGLNVESPEQLRALTADINSYAEVPVLIGIDQEGGMIDRLREERGFPKTVSHKELGSRNYPAATYKNASIIAQTLRQVGIPLNLAPVLDLDIHPDNPIIGKKQRSFSASPDTVVVHAREYIRAHHDQGVLCTLKHFPGHGSSKADSHLGFVTVTELWSEDHVKPYAALVAEGYSDAVMTAHIHNDILDEECPATLSPAVIGELLRVKVGFDGVVISDDMMMGAIVNFFTLETAIVKAVMAGVDILSFGNNLFEYEPDIIERAFEALKKAVKDKEIPEERIDQSFERIMTLKKRMAPHPDFKNT